MIFFFHEFFYLFLSLPLNPCPFFFSLFSILSLPFTYFYFSVFYLSSLLFPPFLSSLLSTFSHLLSSLLFLPFLPFPPLHYSLFPSLFPPSFITRLALPSFFVITLSLPHSLLFLFAFLPPYYSFPPSLHSPSAFLSPLPPFLHSLPSTSLPPSFYYLAISFFSSLLSLHHPLFPSFPRSLPPLYSVTFVGTQYTYRKTHWWPVLLEL